MPFPTNPHKFLHDRHAEYNNLFLKISFKKSFSLALGLFTAKMGIQVTGKNPSYRFNL